MARQQWVLTARVVLETDSRNKNATNTYAKQALKSWSKGLKNATAATAVFDEHDRLVGMDVNGNPSEEMKTLMNFEFGDDDEPVEVTGA
jgi:hypothetical protein